MTYVPLSVDRASWGVPRPAEVAGESHAPCSAPPASETRRVTPAAAAEPLGKSLFFSILLYYKTDLILAPNSTTTPPPDLKALWDRIQDQDRRIHEIEASDIAIRGVMVTHDTLQDTDKEIREMVQGFVNELRHKSRRVERKVNACADGDVQAILTKLVDLGEQVVQVGEILDGQDTHMREELQAAVGATGE